MAWSLSNPTEQFTRSSPSERQENENAGPGIEDDEGLENSWDMDDQAFERAMADFTGQQPENSVRHLESDNSASWSEFRYGRNISHHYQPFAAFDGALDPRTSPDRISHDRGRISERGLRVVNTSPAESPPSPESSLPRCWPCSGHHDPDKLCPNIQASGPSESLEPFPIRQDRRSAAERLIERHGEHFISHNPFADPNPPRLPLPAADRVIELASQDLSEQIRGMAPPVEVDTTWVDQEGPVKREDFKKWEARQEAESSTLRQLIIKAAQTSHHHHKRAHALEVEVEKLKNDIANINALKLKNQELSEKVKYYEVHGSETGGRGPPLSDPSDRPPPNEMSYKPNFNYDQYPPININIPADASVQPSAKEFIHQSPMGQSRELHIEILLLRAKLAWKLGEWGILENSARHAAEIASLLRYHPLTFRCAFYIAIARFHQQDWTLAIKLFMDAQACEGKYKEGLWVQQWLDRARHEQKVLLGSGVQLTQPPRTRMTLDGSSM